MRYLNFLTGEILTGTRHFAKRYFGLDGKDFKVAVIRFGKFERMSRQERMVKAYQVALHFGTDQMW